LRIARTSLFARGSPFKPACLLEKTPVTVDEFRKMVMKMAQDRMGLKAYCDFLNHKTPADKQLREEYLPLLAVLNAMQVPDNSQFELGDKTETWDGRLDGTHLFEVVQALPKDEYEIRKAIASGGASLEIQIAHAYDHHQFPQAMIDAIKKKHDKNYTDTRTLIVVADGDYTFEDDNVIEGWLAEVRRQTSLSTFREILLIELARLKVFKIF
jgi:hypothetical protein